MLSSLQHVYCLSKDECIINRAFGELKCASQPQLDSQLKRYKGRWDSSTKKNRLLQGGSHSYFGMTVPCKSPPSRECPFSEVLQPLEPILPPTQQFGVRNLIVFVNHHVLLLTTVSRVPVPWVLQLDNFWTFLSLLCPFLRSLVIYNWNWSLSRLIVRVWNQSISTSVSVIFTSESDRSDQFLRQSSALFSSFVRQPIRAVGDYQLWEGFVT